MFGLFNKKKDPPPPSGPAGGNGGNGGGPGPDFSAVDSREKAQALADQGVLVPLLLLPEAFGGQPIVPNTVFVPPWVADLKASTDHNVVMPLAREGKITRYSAVPAWEGSSHVPVSIEIKAHDPGSFTNTLNIWGPAIQRG